ncbi:hypothetical protein NUACC21_07010 [Scytonema sp. NUACC21]
MAPRKRKKSENENPDIQESHPQEATVDSPPQVSDSKSQITATACSEDTQIEKTIVSVHQPPPAVQNSKSIDPNLSLLAREIEKQNSNLSVLAAREFRYQLQQTLVEVMISEPRKFNVLEEFILRASLEFTPSPTVKELASVLGLDQIFVQHTAENLESFKSLQVLSTGEIKITSQGQEFYKRGNISLPPQSKQIYAIADPCQENLTFQFEALPEGIVDLPNLEELAPLENNLPNIQALAVADIQQLIQKSGLGLHVPEDGKILTNFQAIAKPQICWRTLSIFVLLDIKENKRILQVRQDKQVLEKATNWLTELHAQQKLNLNELCQLSEENTSSLEPTPKVKRKTTRKKQQS